MTRKPWIHLVPAVLLAVGIIVSAAIAKQMSDTGWLVLAAPLLLGLTIVGADALGSRLRGEQFVPSWIGLVMAASFLAACLIVALVDPTRVALLIPVLGGACAGSMVAVRPASRHMACRRL